MEKAIINIIDKKAAKQLGKLSSSKRNAYRVMLYAGVQIVLNGLTVSRIADELGYSDGYVSKLAHKWIELMQSGDVMVNLIASAVQKSTKNNMTDKTITKPTQNDRVGKHIVIESSINKKTTRNIFGFAVTQEIEMMERAAKRSSILFMQNYGKGASPRLNGEYYAPGTNPLSDLESKKKWLPLETAALYCGCKAEAINSAGQAGVIERRVYKHSANRNYYEYNVADLDKFIRDNHIV